MKTKILLTLISLSFSTIAVAEIYQIKVSAMGMKPKNNNDENSIVFRHINHDAEGWADIVIAKVKDTQFINSEASYREAAINTGFDSYYSKPTTSRCTGQRYGPSVVPPIDYECTPGSSMNLQKYILLKNQVT